MLAAEVSPEADAVMATEVSSEAHISHALPDSLADMSSVASGDVLDGDVGDMDVVEPSLSPVPAAPAPPLPSVVLGETVFKHGIKDEDGVTLPEAIRRICAQLQQMRTRGQSLALTGAKRLTSGKKRSSQAVHLLGVFVQRALAWLTKDLTPELAEHLTVRAL